ncbi:hypothetical protein D0T49_05640 [Paludibacter sp. 221]|nr:hypothetical protein [Paludibacter sp. 221]
MKKKIIIATAVFAFALVAAFNVNLNLKKESNLSVIALANLEALAGESNSGGSTTSGESGSGHRCSISLECSGTPKVTISCSGDKKCEHGKDIIKSWYSALNQTRYWVKCDGTKTYC